MDFLKKLFGRKKPSDSPQMQAPELPFETLVAAGTDALATLDRLTTRSDIYPVLLGAPDRLEHLQASADTDRPSFADTLAAAEAIEFPAWFAARTAEDTEYYEIPHAAWPAEKQVKMGLSAHLDTLSRKPLPQVVIGLIPVQQAWMLPAFLNTGGWNDCPLPQEHTAIFRKWANDYAAQVTCITEDVIECRVERPPRTKPEALALAKNNLYIALTLLSKAPNR